MTLKDEVFSAAGALVARADALSARADALAASVEAVEAESATLRAENATLRAQVAAVEALADEWAARAPFPPPYTASMILRRVLATPQPDQPARPEGDQP